jgi:hypothetical protein
MFRLPEFFSNHAGSGKQGTVYKVDQNADGNRIPPHRAISRQTSLKCVVLHCILPYHAQRIGLRIRRSRARVLPSTLYESLCLQVKRSCVRGPGNNTRSF